MSTTVIDRRRSVLSAPYLVPMALFVLCLLTFGDLALGLRTGILSARTGDGCGQFIYWRQFAFENVRHGHIPQWDPHVYSGVPFFGGWQAAILYPPNWIYLVLPVKTGMLIDAICSTYFAGWFTSLLAARYRLHPVARLLAGAIVMFSGSFFAHVWPGHLTVLAAMAWTPLALLSADELIDRPNIKSVLVGAFALSMQIFAGHPQSVFNTAFAIAIYTIIRLFRAPTRLRIIGFLIAMGAGAACIGAVQLLTGIQVSTEGVRSSGSTFNFVAQYSLPPENLLTIIAPLVFGDMAHVAYWGRWEYWEASGFIGVSALVLAAAGFLYGVSERKKLWLTMAVLMLVIALGKYTPVLHLLYAAVPGFSKFRASNRMFFEATLFLSLLSASGLDAILCDRKLGNVPAWLSAAIAVIVLALCLAARLYGVYLFVDVRDLGDLTYTDHFYHTYPYFVRALRLAEISLLLAAGAAVLTSAALLLCRRSRRWGYALALLSIVELTSFGRSMVTTFNLSDSYPPVISAWHRTHPGDYRVLQLGAPYNSAIGLGTYDIWGYDPVVMRRYSELLTASQGEDVNNPRMTLAFDKKSDVVRLLGCRFVLVNSPGQEIAFPINGALPSASIIYNYSVLRQRDTIIRVLLDPKFDGQDRVILEKAPGIVPGEPASPSHASVKWLGTDAMEIDAETDAPGILLVNECYSRFWRPRALSGSSQQSYDIQPGDYTQIAIPVQAGRHRIELSYCPTLFHVGAILSLVSILAFMGLSIFVWGRPEKDLGQR